MSYTRAWDATTPLGTRAAREIDDSIREKMVDLEERLTTILATGTDLDTDPLRISPAAIGEDTATPMTRVILVPPWNMVGVDDGNRWDHSGAACRVDPSAVNQGVDCGIYIPIGYKIILFEAYMDKENMTNMTTKLVGYRMTDGSTQLSTVTLTRTGTGIGLETSAAIDHTVGSHTTFKVWCSGATGGFPAGRGYFYGARITCEVSSLALGY